MQGEYTIPHAGGRAHFRLRKLSNTAGVSPTVPHLSDVEKSAGDSGDFGGERYAGGPAGVGSRTAILTGRRPGKYS